MKGRAARAIGPSQFFVKTAIKRSIKNQPLARITHLKNSATDFTNFANKTQNNMWEFAQFVPKSG